MSILPFESLKGLTGFRDIKYILERACRKAIGVHPHFERDIAYCDFETRADDPYYKLYSGGNVVQIFFADRTTCGNFELAGRWEKNGDILMYLNVFQIVHDEEPIELYQIGRYQIRVDKNGDGDCSKKIHVNTGNERKFKKRESMNVKVYFLTAVISVYGICLFKRRCWDGDLYFAVTDTIEHTFDRVSSALNISKY